MKPTRLIPDDPALPGLVAIRADGLARTIPVLGMDPVDLRLIGYTPGQRATLEARAGGERVAVKCYAKACGGEASVYQTLALAGLTTNGSPVRVPQLLALDTSLSLLVISWLEGPTARELLERSQGSRAGELAARWLRCSASLEGPIGPAFEVEAQLARVREWAASLAAADRALGVVAATLADRMSETMPPETDGHLVHGRLYIRHVLDVGDACGLIDWERFGQGPLEVDAGMCLATLWRSGQKDYLADEAHRAEASFREATADLLDESRLAWYRAGALFRLASHQLARTGGDWQARVHAILTEALHGIEAGWPCGTTRLAWVPVVDDAVFENDAALAPSAAGASTATRPWTFLWAIPDGSPGNSGPTGPPLALMQVLWDSGELTAEEMTQHLDRTLDRTTVAMLLSRLERQGVVTHRIAGHESVYRAAMGRAEARQSFVQDVATFGDELFEGDTAALVCQLVQTRDVSSGDLARVIALLQAREKELEGERP